MRAPLLLQAVLSDVIAVVVGKVRVFEGSYFEQ